MLLFMKRTRFKWPEEIDQVDRGSE